MWKVAGKESIKMKILKPITTFDVELENYETLTIEKTCKILFDLQDKMKLNYCTEITCADYDDDVIITIDTLKTIRYYLNNLINIKEIH